MSLKAFSVNRSFTSKLLVTGYRKPLGTPGSYSRIGVQTRFESSAALKEKAKPNTTSKEKAKPNTTQEKAKSNTTSKEKAKPNTTQEKAKPNTTSKEKAKSNTTQEKAKPNATKANSKPPASPKNNPVPSFYSFYRRFPDFKPNPRGSLLSEFKRLTEQMKWNPNDPAYQYALRCYKWAVTGEFNKRFGTDATRLEAWQKICTDMGVKEVPQSITQCKKVIDAKYINLYDLLETRRARRVNAKRKLKPRTFPNAWSLSAYSQRTGKLFPRERYAGGVLKYFLRKLWD